ncbi:MAG: hypothetical protein KDI79_04595 [Anaerolineae bacterium]|nr:hypothetical protein [Anaerolineae bacterium]
MKNWYTLHTKPNCEYQVAELLKEYGVTVFLPEFNAVESPQQNKKKPLFPSYLFIKVDLEAVGIATIRWTPGLRRVVSFDDRPLSLNEEVIDFIRSRLKTAQRAQSQPHHFKSGDPVSIKEGPFEGMEAIFHDDQTPAGRVQILLKILGQVNRVMIDVDALEEAPQQSASSESSKRSRRSRGRGRLITDSSISRHKDS